MAFSEEDRGIALEAAFRALVFALAQSKSLDIDLFDRHSKQAVKRLVATGESGASACAAALLTPLTEELRLAYPSRGTP